jgi:hypothetical protein
VIGGLLIAGRNVLVPGLTIIPPAPAGPQWASLTVGDYRMRHTSWVRAVMLHTTGGHWPQPIIPGAGPAGHARQIAEMWSGADRGGGDQVHSAAQLLVDYDGSVACLCDLAHVAAYHAEMSNDWSVGVELCTRPDGSIYQATIDATVALVPALCDALGIPLQIHSAIYHNQPLLRMEETVTVNGRPQRKQFGGPDCVGVLGHRDNTGNRGRGDPGDAIYTALIDRAGAEPLDFSTGEDLRVGAARQAWLVAHGAKIKIDGLVGPVSLAAAKRQGFAAWRLVPTS